jgi:hypothetical protein
VTADSSWLLKLKYCTKEQHVVIVEQYFRNNEGFFNQIHFFINEFIAIKWYIVITVIQPENQFNNCTTHYRVISRFGHQRLLDFIPWGYLKSKIHTNKPTITRAQEEEIERKSPMMEDSV